VNEQRELETLGRTAASQLRRRRARAAALSAWTGMAWFALALPICVAVAHLLREDSRGGVSLAAVTAFVALGVPAAAALVAFASASSRELDPRTGLARLDRELLAQGRLQAAHEFLGRPARSSFMEAAVEDARVWLARARAHRLAPEGPRALPRRAWYAPLAALVLSALVAWLPQRANAEFETPNGSTITAAVQAPLPAKRSPAAESQRAAPPEAAVRERDVLTREQTEGARSAERAASREPEREAKQSTGKTGAGRSAEATPTTASSDSRGFQSSPSQPSGAAPESKLPQKPSQRPRKEPDSSARKQPQQPSGSTAGKGAGSGSSRNPGSTEWASKDQVATDEEEPLDDDQEVDDESSEDEARGGLQPSLRDRRPAVNRDLVIGFGNQIDPNANSRGGASEQKKSRGVASLVLGVPIPDHVKGQPNPGRTKITQEKVEPRAESAAPIESAPRAARDEALGTLTRRELTPWMRELVKRYFSEHREPNETP
jgi:hypothetical protein